MRPSSRHSSLADYLLVEDEHNNVMELSSLTDDESQASGASLMAVPTRTLNSWKLAALAYVAVCGEYFLK